MASIIKNKLRYIEIETCSSCTRKCRWCLFGNYPDIRPKENRLLETCAIESALCDLSKMGFNGVVALYSINEPLLDPRIISGELIILCKSILGNSVKISITTNGDLLNNHITCNLFQCGLDRLKISCYDDYSYSKALKLQLLYSNVFVLDQRRYNDGLFESNRGGSVNSLRNAGKSFDSCCMPSYRTVIGWDGFIRICPHEMLGRITLGNIYETTLYQILSDKKNAEIRYIIENNRKTFYPCNLCNIDGSELYMKNHLE